MSLALRGHQLGKSPFDRECVVAARRFAEIGCTANQIAAITGHATLKEVQRYTSAADRKRMAREAMQKLVEGGW